MNGFLIRWALAFILLAATYNPTRWNFLVWASENYMVDTALAVLFALLLTAGYIIYLRATLRSIGLFGMSLVAAIAASGVWVLIDQGFVSLGSPDLKIWVAILGLSFVLGIGLSWSHVRRFLSGQFDMGNDDD